MGMRIEQVNENQIRCILTQEDLDERKIKFSELTYGSEKATRLFRDVIQQAGEDYGFIPDEHPLMIEAVPMQSGMVVFVITKVTTPDDFDSRLSQLVSALRGSTDEEGEGEDFALEGDGDGFSAQIHIHAVGDTPSAPIGGLSLRDLFHEMFSRGTEAAKSKPVQNNNAVMRPQNRIYTFRDIASVLDAAAAVRNFELGESVLYKNPADGSYYLLLYADYLTPAGYNLLTVTLADFSADEVIQPTMEAYMEEHFDIVVAEHALQALVSVDQ
ncbi:MAG: adaptor protein MecA [Lachnospiraceae bacterium]|nr:adaptor protein MecA [Lachnospiraceae bacterium]